jgi:hypothetical protein
VLSSNVKAAWTMVRSPNEKSPTFYACLGATFIACAVLVYYDLSVLAFVLAIFVLIWCFGLREKFSNETTASAYSVFNKDGKAIVGGFTASQLERQLRGPFAGANNDPEDPLTGNVAEHSTMSGQTVKEQVSEKERLRRRRAAADAAQRRFQGKEAR